VLGPSKLGALAKIQLEAWQAIAVNWAVYFDLDTSQLRCSSCHASVLVMADERGHLYHYSEEQVLACKVMHLRARHASLDPDK
jgi:hypothetical protein